MDSIIQYDKSEFHETSSGIKISKKSIIKGTEQINVSGRCIFFNDVILRGDLAKVSIGKYLVVHEKVTLKPSYTYGYTKESPTKKVIKFLPLMISDYVEIESSSIIQATKIGMIQEQITSLYMYINREKLLHCKFSMFILCSLTDAQLEKTRSFLTIPYCHLILLYLPIVYLEEDQQSILNNSQAILIIRIQVYIAETPESTAIIQKQKLVNFYKNFVPKS